MSKVVRQLHNENNENGANFKILIFKQYLLKDDSCQISNMLQAYAMV